MGLLSSLPAALFVLALSDLGATHAQPLQSFFDDAWPAWQERHAQFRTLLARDESRPEPSNEPTGDTDYRPAREIKKFTAPRVRLKGTAEELGLNSRALASFLETQFLEDFAFLQRDFAFDKTYETWEIGMFECEAWTVGGSYPIAFHVQCAAGSMDEPRNWLDSTLGYGPKEKIADTVRTTLDSIIADYAAFVRKARGKNGS